MNVGQICTRQAVTICADAALSEAKRLMCENHVEAIVVIASAVERPTALGIFTDGDIARVELERPADVAQLPVSIVLSRNPLVFYQDDTLESAIQRLRVRRLRHALVMGSAGTLWGLISLDDLLSRIAA